MNQHLISPFGGVTLRPYIHDDLPHIAGILLDGRTWSKGFGDSSSRIPQDLSDAVELVRERHEGMTMFTIYDSGQRGGGVLGTTGIVHWDFDREAVKIGRTLIHPSYWGMKCNHEAKIVFIDWLFSMGIGRIECDVAPANMNSIKSLERFGFTFEGVRRRAVRRSDGTWRDTVIFSMVTEEWAGKRALVASQLTARSLGLILP